MLSEAERLLIAQIRQGDQRAWGQLIDRYEGRLQAFAYGRLRDRSLAEDVVQETFIGFANSLANFDDSRELQTYLFTIASYKITDQLRRRSRKPLHTGEAAEDRLNEAEDQKLLRASSVARRREREAHETQALTLALRDLLQQLFQKGDITRVKVLELLFVKGWANRVIARELNISEQQVANFRFAAVKKVTERIQASGLSPDIFPELRDEPK